MATKKYTCPPQLPSGQGTFSDQLVGLQLVNGGGLTLGNFEFTSNVQSKNDRTFDTGSYSSPISLTSLNIKSVEESNKIYDTNFTIFPNYDLSEILNFVGYGPLTKRFSAAVTKIINYYPAALEVNQIRKNFTSGPTAYNITYNGNTDTTVFVISASTVDNPFGINYTKINLNNQEDVSDLRNLTKFFKDYVLELSGQTYQIVSFTPSTQVTAGTITFRCEGNPFSGNSITNDYLVIRPNDVIVNKVFNLDLDEVEEYLLNRFVVPKYTAKFKVPRESDSGGFFLGTQYATWPLDGKWNIDIRTRAFDDYLILLSEVGNDFDLFKTNVISRFYVTQSFQEFDTDDGKVDKILKIYGRSFDESKKYVDAIAHVTSVNYNVGNDIPSKLLTNLSQTLGWSINIAPDTSTGLIDSLYGVSTSNFDGYSVGYTLEELQNQYYRNLILNTGYLFKSKGTRRAVDFVMNYVGVPPAIYEFNESIYKVDAPVTRSKFESLYSKISGGTFISTFSVLDPTNTYFLSQVKYTGYTTSTTIEDVFLTIDDYPVNTSTGYPKSPQYTDDFFFQKGEGWFESTVQHRSPEVLNITSSVFTGQSPIIQTVLEPFTYGTKYLNRFLNFPYLDYGFALTREIDNTKSWSNTQDNLRYVKDGGFDTIYEVPDDRLVLNVKNTEIFINPAQGLVYDVWYLSRTKNYPIPNSGLTSPYPQPGGVDSTFINPNPQLDNFFEFKETFWKDMINVRDRQYFSDGKTSGYPTLESIYWKYLTMYEDTGIENNNFTYQTMLDYAEGIGDYWIRLLEQVVPATTILNTGIKFENSIFHRQKFIYRRQRGYPEP